MKTRDCDGLSGRTRQDTSSPGLPIATDTAWSSGAMNPPVERERMMKHAAIGVKDGI